MTGAAGCRPQASAIELNWKLRAIAVNAVGRKVMEKTPVEIFVTFDEDEHATLAAFPPAGDASPGVKVQHYLVNGSRPLFQFPGTQKVADFDAWRRLKEGEGFMFEPLGV